MITHSFFIHPFLQIPKRKFRDAARDGFHCSREAADEPKRMERVLSYDTKRRDTDYTAEATSKEDGESAAMESGKKNAPSTLDAANSDPYSSNEANDCTLSSIRNSPRNISDDDTGTLGGPVHQTLPGRYEIPQLLFWILFDACLLTPVYSQP